MSSLHLQQTRASHSSFKPDHESRKSSIDVGEVNNNNNNNSSTDSQQETKAFLTPPDDDDHHHPDRPSNIFRRLLQGVTLLLSLGLSLAAYDLYRTATASQLDDAGPCGADPLTARSKACLFDPIAMAWLPDRCHDFELTREFLEAEHWQYWTDSGGGRAISLANVYQGLHSALFVNEAYLRHRCVFAWRKIHRAIINDTAVDGYVTDWDGILECEKLFDVGSGSHDEMLYEVKVKYPTCTDQKPVEGEA
ncbi:hypothetical protein L249_8393 [Ophiocordyceps polyrhachis-furcata BCC 54312]|uniref:Uncharacterized protein n=1 Tax=Ophiocordyceps polyrhachis-furcata BCC 54312 TaxID=1330021 RepID=A0A367L656_9HYPO|nr:hypothetical protein L249_8393 [Ophiocordyceps polyrhachis-furcata BCC 54312]